MGLWLARPPADLGVLALVALVPLFVVWHRVSPRQAAWWGFVAGVVYHALLLDWVRYFGAVAIVPFVAILAGVWAAVGAAAAWLRTRGLGSPLLLAALWIVGEGLIARVPFGGFSWGEVGYAFHAIAPVRAVGALGGLPLVSFVAVCVNAVIAHGIAAWRTTRARPPARAALPLLVPILALALAPLATAATHPDGELQVAIVQGNDKNRYLTRAELAQRFLPTSHFALARTITPPVDLVVLPESSLDADPRADAWLGEELGAIAQRFDATVMANGIGETDPPSDQSLNLNVIYAPDGSVTDEYAKRHLVPFGEYVPLRSWLTWLDAIDQVSNFTPGTADPYITVDGQRLVQEICFEIAFGPQVRTDVRGGAGAIIVSTNNRSYRRSANAAQHLAISQMRAVETGRPVVHAAVSGISGFIDADGTISGQTELFVNAVAQATVGTRAGLTPYVRFGEWVLLAATGAVAAAAWTAIGLRGRRRRRLAPVPAGTPATASGPPPPHEAGSPAP